MAHVCWSTRPASTDVCTKSTEPLAAISGQSKHVRRLTDFQMMFLGQFACAECDKVGPINEAIACTQCYKVMKALANYSFKMIISLCRNHSYARVAQ